MLMSKCLIHIPQLIAPQLLELFIVVMRTQKKRTYEARIREVEHGTFTPLVFSATGGMTDQAIVFYKRLASLLSEKKNEHYAIMMGWIRCCLSFSLLRSAIRCLRGSRSSASKYARENDVEAETGLSPLNV